MQTLVVEPSELPGGVGALLDIADAVSRPASVPHLPGRLGQAVDSFLDAWADEGHLLEQSARSQVRALFAAAERYRELEALLVRPR